MKTYSKTRRSKGFTLIELLVVITIIAVLAAMSFAGVQLALRKAKKTESENLATALKLAVEQFYSEYSRLPDLQTQFKTSSGDGQKLLEILLAQENTSSNMENNRSIVFLNAKESKTKKGGLYYQGNTVAGLYDSFGNPFTVYLNTDYEDELTFSAGGKQQRLRGVNVAVFSEGADGEGGTGDDIKTF